MRTEEYSEIGSEEELGQSETEDELSESETEDELGSSGSEDVSYRLEEEDSTEEESDGSEAVEEITKNEIQIEDLKAKKVKKDVRRYCCQKRSKDENHGLKERNVRRYCCGLCGFTRIRRNSLKAHVISKHSDEIISKGETDCYIAKMRSEHASKSRDTRRYNCSICGLVRSKRRPLKAHLISYHGVEDDIDELIEKKNAEECETLQPEASNSKRVENNGSKVRELRRYCCKLCGLVRAKRELLKNHIHLEHDEEMGSDDVDKFIAKKCSEDDQRRYSCQICGVVRSKRRFLKLHVMSSHGPDALKKMRFALEGVSVHSQNVCDLCGMSFRKPAHLQQHKLSHSPLRSFVCPIDGCLCSYKRQDHLNRHLLKHEGELFMCPREDCKLQFSTLSNLKRHLKQHRERGESWQSQNVKSKEREKHCCPEPNCKKAFKYPSKLAKHLDDVHRTTYTEVICCEPGCLKYFTNAEALKEHLQQNHNRVCCEICGSQQLKKQIKRHMRIHENQTCVKSISCPYERCQHSYTTKSNLNQHIKSVHLGLKPFKCRFGECRMTYAHKSARDRHETSGAHCYVQGNFLEEDAAFQSRPRGGRKRKAFTVDSIFRKRVAGPDESTVLENGLSYMYWLTSNNGD